jgi:hypothetical protein
MTAGLCSGKAQARTTWLPVVDILTSRPTAGNPHADITQGHQPCALRPCSDHSPGGDCCAEGTQTRSGDICSECSDLFTVEPGFDLGPTEHPSPPCVLYCLLGGSRTRAGCRVKKASDSNSDRHSSQARSSAPQWPQLAGSQWPSCNRSQHRHTTERFL